MNLYQEIEKYPIKERCTGSYIKDSDMQFICGLLKKFRPKKILELGVAKGGTTVDILNCLKELQINCEMYSVDISERYFEDQNYQTGYLIKELESKEENIKFHKLILGKYISECIEEIGEGVDFVIMDTVHRIPGEILDFLVIYPYLSRNAIVVLDDIKVHYYRNKNDIACSILFQTVSANKFLNIKEEYPNVGAFQINEYTNKFLLDVFSSLIMEWNDFPEKKCLEQYDRLLKTKYKKEELQIWEYAKIMATYFNKKSKNELNIYNGDIERLLEILKDKEIILYGSGKRADLFFDYIRNKGIDPKGFVVSNGHRKSKSYKDKPIFEIDELKDNDSNYCFVQAALSETISMTMVTYCTNYIILSEAIWKEIVYSSKGI